MTSCGGSRTASVMFLVLLSVGMGCSAGRSLEGDGGTTGGGAGIAGGGRSGGAGGTGGAATLGRKIDLLFMVDDSSEMDTGQANLKASLPALMDVLKGLPGGLPDLHVAVVTSDMGAGDGSSIMGCSVTGDGGVFRFQATGGCASTGLDRGATFLTSTGGINPQTNFGQQDITAVLQCIITVGANGCGFEHQLASVARALGADGSPPPQENQGFLRLDAVLAIVLLTNEDDCSAPAGSALFDPTSSQLSSMFGPTENFQCNEWGHLCTPPGGGAQVRPSRFAPNNLATDVVTYSPAGGPNNCVSSEAQGMLSPVGAGGFADRIRALKTDPRNQILVAALAGPPTEYTVTWRTAPTTDTGPWPQMKHSCGGQASTIGFADPGVRIHQFVSQFANGLFDTYCQADYTSALGTMAGKLSQLIVP
jgi:hypothetical protein